jgi:hypothetical protein
MHTQKITDLLWDIKPFLMKSFDIIIVITRLPDSKTDDRKIRKLWTWRRKTEHRGRVVNMPALYLGNPGFKSRPGGRILQLRSFVVFLSPSRHIRDSILNYATTASFLIPSNSSFTYHPLIRRYIVWESVVKQTTKVEAKLNWEIPQLNVPVPSFGVTLHKPSNFTNFPKRV